MSDSTITSDQLKGNRRTMRVPRSRGAISGVLLMILGAWGALVPFIGPYFDYSYRNDHTWVWTAARFWLEVLPGAATAVGGFLVLTSANRLVGSIGAWLAAAGGAWFVVGQSLAGPLKTGSVGLPQGSTDSRRAIESVGYFYGLGAVILFLAAFALGRLSVVGLRDVRAAEKHARDLAARREADELAAQEQAAQQRAAQQRAAAQPATEQRAPAAYREAEGQRAGQAPTGTHAAGTNPYDDPGR